MRFVHALTSFNNINQLNSPILVLVSPSIFYYFFSKLISLCFINLDDPVVLFSSRGLTSNTLRARIILTCTSDANPPAFIFQWFCNGTQFSNESRNITFSETILEGETLTSSKVEIQHPLSEDPCDYKCEAVSSYGSGSAVFNSTIYRKYIYFLKFICVSCIWNSMYIELHDPCFQINTFNFYPLQMYFINH